jgi:hypothetical protein
LFLGTWVSPSYLENLYGTNHGTYKSCVFQGFIIQLGGLAALLFNASLAVGFLLTVKYHWREKRVRKLYARLQIILWIICAAAAILPIPLHMYHNSGPVCWVDAFPGGCTQSWELGSSMEATDCLAGDNAMFLSITLQICPILFCIVCDSVIMWIIYRTMRSLEDPPPCEREAATIGIGDKEGGIDDASEIGHDEEQNGEKQGSTSENSTSFYLKSAASSSIDRRRSSRDRSRLVGNQALLYIAGFLLTFGLTLLSVFVFLALGEWNTALDRTSYFFLGIQGIWNFTVFSRRRTMKTRVGRGARATVWGTIPRCVGRPSNLTT